MYINTKIYVNERSINVKLYLLKIISFKARCRKYTFIFSNVITKNKGFTVSYK